MGLKLTAIMTASFPLVNRPNASQTCKAMLCIFFSDLVKQKHVRENVFMIYFLKSNILCCTDVTRQRQPLQIVAHSAVGCILTRSTKEDNVFLFCFLTFYPHRNNWQHTQGTTVCTSAAGLSHWRVLKMACRSFIVGLKDHRGRSGGIKQRGDQ